MENRKSLDELPIELIEEIGKHDIQAAARLKLCAKTYYYTFGASFFSKAFNVDINQLKEEKINTQLRNLLIPAAIKGIFEYIEFRDEVDACYQSKQYDKGYHRAFCFLNILQCLDYASPTDNYGGHNKLLERRYTPLTEDQKLMAIYVLLNEANGTRLKQFVIDQIARSGKEMGTRWKKTEINHWLLKQYGIDRLCELQKDLLSAIHSKENYASYYQLYYMGDPFSSKVTDTCNEYVSRLMSSHSYRHHPSNTGSEAITRQERYWSYFFFEFDKKMSLRQENDVKRCHIM